MSPAASPEEAAAVTAAIEQFLADTAPAPDPGANRMPAWQWAGLQEGVRRAELACPAGLRRG